MTMSGWDGGEEADGGESGAAESETTDFATEIAAVVRKPCSQEAIEALREEGVYDRGRSVAPIDDDHVAIPVRAPPRETEVVDTRPVELPHRERGLDDLLAERGFSAEEIDAAPSSWAVVGDIVLVDLGDVSTGSPTRSPLPADHRREVGEALLELHPNAETVLARGGVSGARRRPDTEVVAGTGGTETVHVEHGTEYVLDLSEVMFSPGNQAERVRMGEVVEPDELVFDMFAGVGYFALPMARGGARVVATEINPVAHRLLVEGARRNGVDDRIDAVLGDCRDVELEGRVDRVVMGYYDAYEYLDVGLSAIREGGTLHLHEATPNPRFPDRPVGRLEAVASEAGRAIEVLESRVVKDHSPGVVHGVVDARVD